MSFTYSDELATDRDRVRARLRDVTSGAGPLPADANFSDGEIAGLLADEGSWQRAVAGGFEMLAAAWARYVSFNADGTQVSRSDVAARYDALAAQWRKKHGSSGSAGSSAVTRADGYSDDLDNVTA